MKNIILDILEDSIDAKRQCIEKHIDHVRPKDENNIHKLEEKSRKKKMTIYRIIAILFLGIFGSITLVSGIAMILQQKYVFGIPFGALGAVLVLAFLFYEKYR